MKCADPVLCYTVQNSKRIFRHFSILQKSKSLLFNRKPDQVFDCGKCLTCRKKRAYELACRCVLHASLYEENCFLTLTYDETKENYHNEFQYEDIQKFKKKLRQYVQRLDGRRIEIFNVHEYGKNGKKHWHLIVFNFNFGDRTFKTERNGQKYYVSDVLSRLWRFGTKSNQIIGDISEASALYQAQYAQKDFKNGNVTNGKKSHSKHSGIGKPYFEKHYDQILRLGYIPFNGRKLPIPRYFQRIAHKNWSWFYDRSHFYDTEQRNRLYTPFATDTDANLDMANLWPMYRLQKDLCIADLEVEWSNTINTFLTSGDDPDFILSNANALYDLQKKNIKEKF